MADGAKFEVGKIYGHSFIGDSDARVYWRVSSRSGSMMTIESVGWGQKESRRVKIRERPGEGEWAYSMGQYSMAPIIRANKEGKFSRSGEKDMMAIENEVRLQLKGGRSIKIIRTETPTGGMWSIPEMPEIAAHQNISVIRDRLRGKGLIASRLGAKATFKVEDRFYFGKGRKERFADDRLAKFLDVYNKNENNNYHSENVVLLAKFLGSTDDVAQAQRIANEQRRSSDGISEKLYKERTELNRRLLSKFRSRYPQADI